jgi:hypothetical protein
MSKVKVRFGMLRCFSSGGAAVMAFLFGIIGNMTNQKAFTLFGLAALGAIIPLQFLPCFPGSVANDLTGSQRIGLYIGKAQLLPQVEV